MKNQRFINYELLMILVYSWVIGMGCRMSPFLNRKFYKSFMFHKYNMFPGNRKVAGCFNFSIGQRKVYKVDSLNIINMLPSDLTGSLDDCFSKLILEVSL